MLKACRGWVCMFLRSFHSPATPAIHRSQSARTCHAAVCRFTLHAVTYGLPMKAAAFGKAFFWQRMPSVGKVHSSKYASNLASTTFLLRLYLQVYSCDGQLAITFVERRSSFTCSCSCQHVAGRIMGLTEVRSTMTSPKNGGSLHIRLRLCVCAPTSPHMSHSYAV